MFILCECVWKKSRLLEIYFFLIIFSFQFVFLLLFFLENSFLSNFFSIVVFLYWFVFVYLFLCFISTMFHGILLLFIKNNTCYFAMCITILSLSLYRAVNFCIACVFGSLQIEIVSFVFC